jgi:cell migration-inducing and hyaluronan-binding protein
LRPQWYLLTNSVLSDVQNGGLTFVSGGDYTHSSVIGGYWALARNTVFIGNTRDNARYGFASNIGPFNNASGLKCDQINNSAPAYCLSVAEGVSMPTIGFFTNQRLSNIYDGPSYQDSNVYLDITRAGCALWSADNSKQSECMYGSSTSYLRLKETPRAAASACYLPNAKRCYRLETAEWVLLPACLPFEKPVLRQCRYPTLRDRPVVREKHL